MTSLNWWMWMDCVYTVYLTASLCWRERRHAASLAAIMESLLTWGTTPTAVVV